MIKSLKSSGNALASPGAQLEMLARDTSIPAFEDKLAIAGLHPLRPLPLRVMQVNMGKMCNQTCRHCHVDAGPDRREIMTRETMQQCLDALAQSAIPVVDLTGGAPEMNPEFRWFVEQIKALGRHVIVRCNLTIIVSNKKYHDLPQFFATHGVEVISSLPFYNARRTDSQRGEGVFERSIAAMKMLNDAGYGMPGSGLLLNLVYNPTGAFLPAGQADLQKEFATSLLKNFGVTFNQLFAITNMPISRFLDYLVESGNYEGYMEKLVTAFNPTAAAGVMCRDTLSIGWDGQLFDCDFNQMLELGLATGAPQHISAFSEAALASREIVVNQHCFGCTAGAGSSCGGELV